MFVRGQSAGGDLDEVNLVEFHETAPAAPAPSHGQVSGTEDVVCDVIVTRGSDGQTAKGVRIGDIGDIILATLG